MSPRPRNDERHPDLQTAIKEAAWKQIAELGATALNLRGIARDLGIAAPSIYNYFPNRDNLVTSLIADAYNSLADSQFESLNDIPNEDLSSQITSLGLAYRNWALTYPQRYHLIFGTPIPHYHAPEEVTKPAADRSLRPLINVIDRILTLRNPPLDNLTPMNTQLTSMLNNWRLSGENVNLEVLYLALIIWSRVHGLVLLEIGKQFPPFIDEPGELFKREISSILIQYQLGE
jgi:AcrR family transcriptional regulator